MIYLRSAIFNVVFYVTFALMMVLGMPCLLVPRLAMVVVKLWARVSIALLARICGVNIEFRNLHLLPEGASIIAAKHQSFLETFALITVLDDFNYVLKKELMSVPFFGWYLRATGQIGIDRSKRSGAVAEMKRAVQEKLAAGHQVVIFPEGTRRSIGAPPLYKPGVAALCAAAGAPCTPVALNTGLFWPRHSFLRRPGTVVIEFLPPIPPGMPKAAFMRALLGAIEPASNALVAEALADHPNLDAAIAKKTPATA